MKTKTVTVPYDDLLTVLEESYERRSYYESLRDWERHDDSFKELDEAIKRLQEIMGIGENHDELKARGQL